MNSNLLRQAILMLACCLFLRILTLDSPSMIDPSEARFAVGAKQMLESGEWIFPKLPKGDETWVPFFSKPPLQYWLNAISLETFGLHDWSVRLPSALASFVVAFLCAYLCWVLFTPALGITSASIFLTSLSVFVFSGASLSDLTLSACVVGAFVSYALAVHYTPSTLRGTIWGYAFFASLGLGMLTKGPLALIIPVASLGMWLVLFKKFPTLKSLPWISGSSLFLLITLPWFILAEYRSPGFLWYFFINENLRRYTSTEFGNVYGGGHLYPYGTAWLMLLLNMFPWTFVLVFSAYRGCSSKLSAALRAQPWLPYILCWVLGPTLFLTFARNLLPTYLLPAAGPLAILLALLIQGATGTLAEARLRKFFAIACKALLLVVPLLALAAMIIGRQFVTILIGLVVVAVIVQLLKGREILRNTPDASLVQLTMLTASLTSAVLVMTLMVTDPILSPGKSTGPVISWIRDHQEEGQAQRIGFLFANPISAAWYSRTLEGKDEVVTALDYKEAERLGIRTLVMNEKNRPQLIASELAKLKLEKQIGKWQIYSRIGN